MTGTQIENSIRRQLRHEQGRFDHQRIIDEINAGLYDFCAETFALTKVVTYSAEQFKRDYDFPDDFMDIRNIFYNNKPLTYRSQQEMKDIFARQGEMGKTGTPGIYWQPLHGKFALHPIPDSNRLVATMALSATAATNVISVVSAATSGWNTIGYFLVSDVGEVIQYFNLTTNTFNMVTRAEEETSAETIATDVSLRERDIKMDYYALDLGFIPDTMGNSPQLSKEYHNAVIDYALWRLLPEIQGGEQLSQKYELNYLRVRREAKGKIKKQQRSRLLEVRDVAFGNAIR